MDIAHAADHFIRHGQYLRNWSPRTIRTYRTGMSARRHAVGHDSDLTKADLQQFVIAMRERGLTAGGCNMYIRPVNSFMTWLHEDGRVPARLRLKLLSNPPKAFHGFTDVEMRRVVALRPTGRTERRTWSLFVCLLDTGIRIDEALGLEHERVSLDALTITVRGKGNRERTIPISVECRKALFRLRPTGRTAQLERDVFATASGGRISYRNAFRDLKALCLRAGVRSATKRAPRNVLRASRQRAASAADVFGASTSCSRKNHDKSFLWESVNGVPRSSWAAFAYASLERFKECGNSTRMVQNPSALSSSRCRRMNRRKSIGEGLSAR